MRRYVDTNLVKWRDWYGRILKCWAVLSVIAPATVAAVAYVQQWPGGMALNCGVCAAYVVGTVLWLLTVRLDVLHSRLDMIRQHVLVVE